MLPNRIPFFPLSLVTEECTEFCSPIIQQFIQACEHDWDTVLGGNRRLTTMLGTYQRKNNLFLKLHIIWGKFVNKYVAAWKKTVVKSILSSGQLGCLGSSPWASFAWLFFFSNASLPVFEKLTGDYLQVSSKAFFHRLNLYASFRFLKVRSHPSIYWLFRLRHPNNFLNICYMSDIFFP